LLARFSSLQLNMKVGDFLLTHRFSHSRPEHLFCHAGQRPLVLSHQ
jgi:hypothetical protein